MLSWPLRRDFSAAQNAPFRAAVSPRSVKSSGEHIGGYTRTQFLIQRGSRSATSCLGSADSQGEEIRSLDVAGCGPVWHLPATTVAGRGLAWPDAGGRWLPVWLPHFVSAANLQQA